MSGRLGRRSGAAVALVAAFLLLAPAGPAGAAPTITVDQPTDAQVLASSTVTVAGSATAEILNTMTQVVESVGTQTNTTTCKTSPCPFSWKLTLASNGAYQAKVVATQSSLLLGPVDATATVAFTVDAPPQAPVLDPPTVTDARAVTLSWSRNTEPDMLYYAVFRKDPGGTKFLQIGGKVTQPTSGAKVTFTDTTTTFNGGDFAYQVVAVRKGAAAGAEHTSDPSASKVATVPPPPTSTTTPPPPGSPAAIAAGPTTSTVPGPPAGVDLGGFLSSHKATPISVPPITIPDAPDGTYNATLPFGTPPTTDAAEDGAGDSGPAATAASIVSNVTERPLVPVAAGLLLLMLAMHMRLLNRRLKPASGDLPVDLIVAGPVSSPSTSAPPTPRRSPPPAVRLVAKPGAPPQLTPVAEPRPRPRAPIAAGPAAKAFNGNGRAPAAGPPAASPPSPSPSPSMSAAPDAGDARWAPWAAQAVALDAEEPVPAAPATPTARPHHAADSVDAVALLLDDLDDLVELDDDDLGDVLDRPDPPPVDDSNAIEVFEVVTPTRRHLARSAGR